MVIDRQEESSAARRYDRRMDEEARDPAVQPMSATAAADQPVSGDGQPESAGLPKDFALIWLLRFILLAYGYEVLRMLLDDDAIKLRALHTAFQLFQKLASIFGSMALDAEQQYNEYVKSLH